MGEKLPWRRLQKQLTKRGWLDLNQDKVRLKVNGVVIEARGTDDAHLELDDYRRVEGKVSKTADIAIGVTHAPYAVSYTHLTLPTNREV